MAWSLIDAAESLRAEFNRISPRRDKASDGAIGNDEHSKTSSDHNPDETGKTPYNDVDDLNEVHAIDVDSSGPWPPGWSMQKLIDVVVARCRTGAEKRLQNIIYNRKIISRSWGWSGWRAYTGANPHTQHAHFGFRYGSGSTAANPENITAPWGIRAAVEDSMAFTSDDKTYLDDLLEQKIRRVWAVPAIPQLAGVPDGDGDGKMTAMDVLHRIYNRAAMIPDVAATLQQLAATDHVDEQALATALAPAVAALVLANLPEFADQISQDEVTEAVKAAFHDAFTATAE